MHFFNAMLKYNTQSLIIIDNPVRKSNIFSGSFYRKFMIHDPGCRSRNCGIEFSADPLYDVGHRNCQLHFKGWLSRRSKVYRMKLFRHSLLCFAALLLLFSVPLPCEAAENTIPGNASVNNTKNGNTGDPTVTIFIASDLHLLSPSLTDGGEAFTDITERSDGKAVYYSDELLNAFVQEVLAASPDYVLMTGDLTFNGEKQSHLDLAEQLRVLEDNGISCLVIPGNHDLNCRSARKYSGSEMLMTETADPEGFAQIYSDFGYEQAVSRAPDSLSYTYDLADGLRLLCIDVNTPEFPGLLTQGTLDWAEMQLKEAEKQNIRVIACSHQNLNAHNSLFIDGYNMGYASSLRSLYKEHGVSLNFSGHIHLQHISQIDGVTDIATSAMCVYPCHYGIFRLERADSVSGNADGHKTASVDPAGDDAADAMADHNVIRGNDVWSYTYETKEVDVTGMAQRLGSEDPVLLDFKEYCRSIFTRTGMRQLEAELAELPVSDEVKAEMADGISRLNLAYFSGRLDTFEGFEDLLELWQKNAPQSFYIVYLLSLKDEEPADMTVLQGTL